MGRQVVGGQVLGREPGVTVTGRPAATGARVWALTSVVALAAVAVPWILVDGAAALVDVPGSPVLVLCLLVVGFALAELAVVYLPIGRNAYSLTLNEIPLVVGLLLLPPTDFVLARVAGAAVPLAWRNRRSLRKLAFNLALYALEAGTAVAVFLLVLDGAAPLGPRGWLAVGAAVVTSDLLCTLLITLVIAAHTGTRPQLQRDVVSLGPLAPLVNASFALVLVYVLTVDWRAVWTVGVVVGVLALAQRAQHSLRRRTESLEQLAGFTAAVGGQLDVAKAAQAGLGWISRSLQAEVVELSLSEEFAGRSRRWVARYDEPASEVTVEAAPARATALAPWAGEGLLLVRRRTRDRAQVAALAGVGLRDALVMRLEGDGQAIGMLLVGDRLGDVETFSASDLRELQALGNHLSVTLRNARRADVIREHTQAQLHRSLHDDLTGLPNRRHLEQRLAEHLADGGPASAVLLDLDRFKDINDTLGHGTGDALLRMVAERLARAAPAGALTSRLGADEFAVLLPGTEETAAASVAALLRHEFTVPFALDDLQVTVEVSAGVATAAPGSEPAQLLRHADIAMYVAKSRRTGVEVYRPELEAGTPARLTVLTELRDAIARGELVVHFQPKIALADGSVLGAEALVRWLHPQRGIIAPDEFVPVAEHSGLITPLTFAVLRQALEACAAWRRAGHALGVAVNISPRSLLDPAFVDDVTRTLAAAEVPASAVTLEITETSLMADPERAVEAMRRLRDVGLHLSIDDLGTGYSSLSYLQRLPVSEVKIDRSFLAPGSSDVDAFALVGAVIDMGHRLGRHVVAEGVEDERTWSRLAELGCDSAQGFWMSRPVPADRFLAWVDSWRPPAPARLRALR